MNTVIPGAIFALAFSGSVMADQYTASIDGCRDAIGEQMGITDTDVQYKLKNVESRARARKIGFVVSVRDDTSSIQGVVVTCKVKRSGDVLALNFADGQYPDRVAAQ